MSSISSITQSTCFDAIQKTISWQPDLDNTALPEKIRTVVLEKLLACQQEFLRLKDEITSEQIKNNHVHSSLELLKKLKLFSDKSKTIDVFLTTPFGKKLIQKDCELRSAIEDRLEVNYRTINSKLQPVLENLSSYLEQHHPLSIEFYEKLFEDRYECPTFAPLYLKFLMKESPIQVKDWLNSKPELRKTLSTYPCNILPKLFHGFEQNLNENSYPKGFLTANLQLLNYYSAFNAIKSLKTKRYLQYLTAELQIHHLYLTQLDNRILKSIVKFTKRYSVHKKQLKRFLEKQNRSSIYADFPFFESYLKLFPTVKSKHWRSLLSLYQTDSVLLENLQNQKCLRGKTKRQDKLIKVGCADVKYLSKLISLMNWCRENKIYTFYKLVKHFSAKQLLTLKPLLALAQDEGSRSLIIKGLQGFADKNMDMQPLLNIPDDKRVFLLVLFKKMNSGTAQEIEQIFKEYSLNKLYMQLYHPFKVNSFILRYQEATTHDPSLKKPFENWLKVTLEFARNRKSKIFEQKNRSIALRALEMPPEHLTPFFTYACEHFHFDHLSNLLALEATCREQFGILLDFVKKHPELLVVLKSICDRLGKPMTTRLLKTWKVQPDVAGVLLNNPGLSENFFEGFFLFLKTDPKRIDQYLYLNTQLPDIFSWLDQDIHLISTRFLSKLCTVYNVRLDFGIVCQRAPPHLSSKWIRLFCECYENHELESLRALAVARRHPLTLLYFIRLIEQDPAQAVELLKFLEECNPKISLPLVALLENPDNNEFIKAIYEISNKHNDTLLAMRLIDMALEGYAHEALAIANRFLCLQFNDLNKIIFSLANSHNARLLYSILHWNERQKLAVQPLLRSSRKKDLLITLKIISEERYSLLDIMPVYRNPQLHNFPQQDLIAEKIAKGNLQSAEWLLTNQLPKRTVAKIMILPLLEGIQKGSALPPNKKDEALEVGLAAGTALSLMSNNGMIQRWLIPQIRETLSQQLLIPQNSDALVYLLNVLTILENDCEDISFKIFQYKKPSEPVSLAVSTIISYFFDETRSDDFRYCVLSALLMRPRQNSFVGNCFASQMSIQTSSCAKGLSLACDDYMEILSTGGLKRIDPVKNKVIEYKLPFIERCDPREYPIDHPLVRARETLLAHMGSGVTSLKLHKENINLFLPKTRHNYLYRPLLWNNTPVQVSRSTTSLLQNTFKALSDVHYDPNAFDPATKSNGAWRLLHTGTQSQIFSYEDYQSLLVDVLNRVKNKAVPDDKAAIDHLHDYLTTSSHFKDKLYSYYKRKKSSPHNTHWLDFSGGLSEGVRIRYFGYAESSMKISQNIRNAKDAVNEIFFFYELLSQRMRERISTDPHFRISVDYPHHCANLVLSEINGLTSDKLLREINKDVVHIRNLIFYQKGCEAFIELFRERLPEFLGAYWAHLMYQENLEIMTLGQFCDASLKALSVLCVNAEQKMEYVSVWENVLRSVTCSQPRVWKIIDTNWKDLRKSFYNVYIGIGGSIFCQQPIFFCGANENYYAMNQNFAQGLWEFTFPIDL